MLVEARWEGLNDSCRVKTILKGNEGPRKNGEFGWVFLSSCHIHIDYKNEKCKENIHI